MRKIEVVFCSMVVLVSPCWGSVWDMTADGLGLKSGNYGASLVIDDFLSVSSLTNITPEGSSAGTVYLDGDKGLGVKTLNASGSKGISGGGGDQDEALIFDFAGGVPAGSIVVGLNSYEDKDDDPVITVTLSSGESLSFNESHQSWNIALVSLGDKKAAVNLGSLVGQGFDGLVKSLTVMEPEGHLYVNRLAAPSVVPEPATIALLGFGSLVLACNKRRG
ncbi:MAG: PEP-CTERM sorting domain-containing protein [Planctomycetota bacterium]